jgi:endonuclease/exonuclease/phosphatase family metal-dependent hydrolase
VDVLKIVTFNLRCVWEGDGINGFVDRGPGVVEKIRSVRPHVIGFQEGIERSVAYLRENLPEYEIVFNQRNADLCGEGMATAYLRGEITLLSSDFFWLSETPDEPGTSYKGSGCPRLCQHALLRRESDGMLFRFYNTHLDFINDDIRFSSMKQILSFAAADHTRFAKTPVFLTGDMNALPNEESMKLAGSFEPFAMTDLTKDVGDTFHGYGDPEKLCKIDYVFADAETAKRPSSARRWTEEKNGVYLSDHYPVEVDIEL